MAEQSTEPLSEKWEEFLSQYGYDNVIKHVASIYPEERSVFVKFEDIEHFDIDFADQLLQNPYWVIEAGEKAVATIAKMAQMLEEGSKINLRIRKLPANQEIPVREIRSKHQGKLIAVKGLVRKSNEVRPRAFLSAHQCVRCGHVIMTFQDEPAMREPLECLKEEGGCGRAAGSTKFKLVKHLSKFIDTEKLEIQEEPESLRAGAQPQSITARVEDDISGKVFPGARVVLTGVLESNQRFKGIQGQTTFDIFLRVNSVDFLEADAYDIEVSDDEMKQIEELARNPNIIEAIRDSISPTIYGLPYEKEALALQLFGGVSKNMPDGTRIRGDIHILLVGDPGTAKSQLLRYMSDITPRGIYASGKSATGAGLTAAAVKDEWSEGRWTLEAGALVLADKGLACIDELDKMSPQDRSSMHEAMEQQTISVAKAGITATLQARTSILGAANPKYGRFSAQAVISEQINLPPTLMSRFDLIFPITDKPDSDEDSIVADHILKAHIVGEIRARESLTEDDMTGERIKMPPGAHEAMLPQIKPELLRKYVFVAKKLRSGYPIMTGEAMNALKVYYLEVRKLGEREEAQGVPITARQLEAFIRVAEASARARMSESVTKEDAQRAIRIVRESLRRVIGHGGDEMSWDSDTLYTGTPKTQMERIYTIKNIMKELLRSDPSGFTVSDLATEAENKKIPRDRVDAICERMRKEGDIFQSGSREGEPRYKFAHEL